MASHNFLEVTQVAVLCNENECVLAVDRSQEGVEVVHYVRAFESFELSRFLHGFLEPFLIHVYLGD